MRLTVLGSAASYADAGRACSGYLIRSGETAVLFDCGNGVLSNLGKVMDPLALDAVFISHEHIDHFADVYALQAALRYAPDGPRPPMPLYLPTGLFERMGAVLSDRGRAELAEAFQVRELEDNATVAVGVLSVTPHEVDHVEPTFALMATDDVAVLCYTADTSQGEAVEAAAHGVDVLIADATLPPEYRGRAAHMTATEAAELAVRADVRTLVLSHLWPSVDRAAAAREAREIFHGRVIVADELFDMTFPEEA
jgi:ribonuclease BN (tRNA processing enzyme)